MKLPKIGLLAILVCMALGSFAQNAQKVRVKGHISDSYFKTVPFYCQRAGGLYVSKDVYIKVNSKGDFDTTFTLGAPCYYKVWKNTIYLTPGDDLEINFDLENPLNTQFKGIGSTANTYLVGRNTDFLGKKGANAKPTFEQTKPTIDSIVNIRQKELLLVQGLTPAFIEDAKKMLIANQASNYISYFMYSKYYNKETKYSDFEAVEKSLKQYMQSIIGTIKPLLVEELLPDNRLVDNPDVVSVISDCVKYGNLDLASYPQWSECISLLLFQNKFDIESEKKVTSELVAEAKAKLASLTDEEFKRGLSKRIEKISKLVQGTSVADMQLVDTKGKKVKLSDFKGKVIYIDFWATWCGPCKQELPHYSKLIEKFKGNKDIVFISISMDDTKEKWLSFIAKDATPSIQLYPVDKNALMKQWQISGIPRFVLIGKDFSIADALADRPSSKEIIEKKINSLL
jgi:Thiol-disulfide isomerase and thioredoxins